MGANLTIGGYPFPLRSYSITEDSTPLAANDTSGSPGVINATISAPDPFLEHIQNTGAKWILDFGHNILLEKALTLTDTRWGTLPGRVTNVTFPGPGEIQITATTDLNKLNTFTFRAQPYRGTLGGLIRSWMTQAGYSGTPVIDTALNTRPINAPGWRGELWYHLKMLAQAHEFDLSLVNGVVTVRTLRQREIVTRSLTTTSSDLPIPQLARAVEVYQWNNTAIDNELVYPVGGWNPETEVLNVNAGELTAYTLELEASVSSIQTPTHQMFVSPQHDSSSVFTIIANDGLPVSPAQWRDGGGEVIITIGEDTRSLRIRLRGATKVPVTTGGFASNFSLALASDEAGSRYSTLRIVGTGVSYDRQKKRFPTGVTAAQTGTDVGVTIDNPFLSDKEQCFRAGTRAALDFAGPVPGVKKDVLQPFPAGSAIGNVAGARVYDKATERPYRIRTAQFSPESVTVTAEDDLTYGDMDGLRIGMTYGQVDASRAGRTYRDDYLAGMR